MRRALAMAMAAGVLLPPQDAFAQASRQLTSSVEVAMLRDDNVVWRPNGESDQIWRISPAADFLRQSARSRLYFNGEFDAERYRRLSSLTTLSARQHAQGGWDWRPVAGGTVALEGGYDSSVNPTDLNIGTGLILGRLLTRQWSVQPSYTQDLSGQQSIVTSYRYSGEDTELTPHVNIHRMQVGVLHRPSSRDEVAPTYAAEVFQFVDGTRLAHLGLLRWTHRKTPSNRITIGGGARYYAGEFRPNVQLEFDRRAGFMTAGAGYTWTQITAIGVTSLVDVHNLQASIVYEAPHGTTLFTTGAYYHTKLEDLAADVWRGSGGVGLRLKGPLYVTVSSALDYQRGRVNPLVPVPPLALGAGRPQILQPPNGSLRRTSFVVALRIAGTTRSAAGPRVEQEPGEAERERERERQRPRGGRRR